MADLASITAVRPTSDTVSQKVTYGATVSAGQTVYLDTTDNEYKLAGATSTTLAKVKGVAITPGVDGGEGYIATDGSIILVGTTMGVGEHYVASATAGGIAPEADLTTGNICTDIGRASSATTLRLSIAATGILHA